MASRSRTGCLTCRQRKLKCGEERPICSQCVKANRECIPSSGITFRHQQNPSMNGDPVARESLKSFYGYKETFGPTTVWVDVPQQLTFVHTNNPYENEDGTLGESATLPGLVMNSTSFDENRGQSSSHTLEQVAYQSYADTHGLEALSAVASSQDQYNYAPPPAHMTMDAPLPSEASPRQDNTTPNTTAIQNLEFILNPPNQAIDPRLNPQSPTEQQQQSFLLPAPEGSSHVRTQPIQPYPPGTPSLLSAKGTIRSPLPIHDPELAFLLRDFSERSGLWMDLFDLDKFFATTVPVLAVSCPLLLYSCVALSAKSLSRVDGRKPVMGGQITSDRQSRMEKWPGAPLDAEGWMWKGRENYDMAVSLLRQALAGDSRPLTPSLPLDVAPQAVITAQGAPLPTTDSDELVAATAILCVYEFLDASGPEWSRHLDGAKSLFDVAKDRIGPLTLPPSSASLAQQVTQRLAGHPDVETPGPKGLSKGRIAVFFNFARQDTWSAFINNTSTRLDATDLPMWQSAGLKLTANGFLHPSNPSHPDYIRENAMNDDMIGNALIWIMMKLVNFIAAGDDLHVGAESPLGVGVRQKELLEYWHSLDEQLQVWYDGLPDTFRPVAVSRGSSGIDEKWFSRSMNSSTVQNYHFARIQLLHNKPHLSTGQQWPVLMRHSSFRNQQHPPITPLAPGSSLAARHASYASILQQSRLHAKEIVAISLGRADEGARLHSMQALWTAGLVLGGTNMSEEVGQRTIKVDTETNMWRQTIVRLLRGIERDMGWATEYRVKNLLNLWGVTMDEAGL